SGGLIHRLAPVSVTVLAIALLAYNVYVWLEARTRLVGDPAASYDALTRLVALDVGALLVGLLAVWLWRGRGGVRLASRAIGRAPQPAAHPAGWDNAFDAMLSFDARGRVRAANRAASMLFKHPAPEVAGEPIHRFLNCGRAGERGTFEPAALDTVARS